MALVHRDDDHLVRIVAPIFKVASELSEVILQRDTQIAVLQARVTILEGELDAERRRRECAEEASEQAGAEVDRLYYEGLRLKARLAEWDVPPVCDCGRSGYEVSCRCGKQLK